MRFAAARMFGLSAVFSLALPAGRAQDRAAPSASTSSSDPRVGLKPGLRDAGEAAWNMERVSGLPKPDGFFNPKMPAGEPTPPERAAGTPEPPPTPGQPPPGGLNFANSDMAFAGNNLFIGNFAGFNTYDIENSRKPRLRGSVVCPGGQGDVSVHGNLLIMSVEQTRGRIDCGTQGVPEPVSVERFRGIRLFDISDVRKPKQIAAVQTCRGSHTHTLVADPHDPANLYVYVSGTSAVRPGEELEGCSGKAAKDDPNTSLYSIDVIRIPLAAPASARIVNQPRLFMDRTTGAIAGLWQGGDHGPGTQRTSETRQCHDITVFPEIGLAAGACAGNGILLDISDPVHPVRLDQVSDKNFAYWHSATFNNDGSKVIFTDEWGGGTRPRCRSTDPPTWGADAIFDVVDRRLRFGGYYKLPVPQTEQENCVAHNGSLVPVPGRDIMVQGWYQGGVSVFDFTDSAHPIEIAFFDRGPVDGSQLITGGYWSTYWHNGFIYGSEIARGVDVFKLTPSEYLSQNEIDAATMVRSDEFNAQLQTRTVWPAASVVARAYIDQLARSGAIQPDRVRTLKTALDRVDGIRNGRDKGAAAIVEQLNTLAGQLEVDARTAAGADAGRLRSLGATLSGRTANLR